MSKRNHLSDDFVRSLRHFVFYYFNGTLNWVTEEKTYLKILTTEVFLLTKQAWLSKPLQSTVI